MVQGLQFLYFAKVKLSFKTLSAAKKLREKLKNKKGENKNLKKKKT